MKTIIMCGVSGSGKSTYIANNYSNAIVYAIDNYLDYEQSTYQNKDKLKKAYWDCLKDFMLSTYDESLEIVVDNSNTTITGIAPFISTSIAFGREVEVIMIKCDPIKAWKRNKHHVSLEDIFEQEKRLKLLPERWSSWWPEIKIIKEE
jgi:predicted kinase